MAFAAAALLTPHPAAAQTTVRGRVVDTTDAALPGVFIQIERGLVRQEAVTDGAGQFAVALVATGDVRLTATLAGFRVHRETLTISADAPDLVIRLEPAGITESVTAVAEGGSYRPATATTGTKLDLPLIDLPQSVTVIPARVVEDRQVVRMAELADNVAGVRASPGYGGLSSANYYMRGFRGSFTGGNLRDGFRDYTFLSSRDMQGIEQTEFLKGPASIMYGQQEVGGIVNTVLKKPQPWRFARIHFLTGAYGMMRPTLDLNTPVTESGSVLVRLNAAYEQADSHRDFVTSRSLYVAPSVIVNMGTSTRLRINVEAQRYRYLFDNGLLSEPEFLDAPMSRYLGEPGFNTTTVTQTGGTIELSHGFGANWNVRSAFNALAAEGSPNLVNPTSLQADRRTVNRSALRSDERSRNYSFQNELYGRFNTGGLGHNMVVGLDLVQWNFRYKFFNGVGGSAPVDRLDPVYGGFPTEFVPFFSDDTTADITGLFVQDQIALRDNLKLLAGVRLDHVRQRSADAFSGAETNKRTLTNVAPRAGLVFNPARSTALYVSYTNSFLPQYGVSRTGEAFDPQRGRQYEAGVKQNLLGDRLFATLAFYQIWKSNVPTTDPEDTRFSILTGEQRSRGGELEVTGALSSQWNVIATYAYTDAFVSRDNRLRVGSRLVGIPEHSGSVWTTYDVARGALAGLSVGGGVVGASPRQARLPNVATVIPSYGRVDLFAAWRAPQWTLQINLKNVNNVRWYEAQGSNIIPQAPRHLLVSVGYQFQ
jgi:iron complex outermembrane receptor protein